MKQFNDLAIILNRIDYAERDRILTLLCATYGKVSVLAKGARSQKSRLAGGIELLSLTEVSFIDGRSNLKTLTGARMRAHFPDIVKDMRSMQLAFKYIKAINGITEDGAGQEYFDLLKISFESLNNSKVDPRITDIWFCLQLLKLSGSEPNLSVAESEEAEFEFNHDTQQFMPKPQGAFTKNDLKLLRLCLIHNSPPRLQNSLGSEDRLQSLMNVLLKTSVTEV